MLENSDTGWIEYGNSYMTKSVYNDLVESGDWMLIITPMSIINNIDIVQGMLEKFHNFGGLKIE